MDVRAQLLMGPRRGKQKSFLWHLMVQATPKGERVAVESLFPAAQWKRGE